MDGGERKTVIEGVNPNDIIVTDKPAPITDSKAPGAINDTSAKADSAIATPVAARAQRTSVSIDPEIAENITGLKKPRHKTVQAIIDTVKAPFASAPNTGNKGPRIDSLALVRSEDSRRMRAVSKYGSAVKKHILTVAIGFAFSSIAKKIGLNSDAIDDSVVKECVEALCREKHSAGWYVTKRGIARLRSLPLHKLIAYTVASHASSVEDMLMRFWAENPAKGSLVFFAWGLSGMVQDIVKERAGTLLKNISQANKEARRQAYEKARAAREPINTEAKVSNPTTEQS